MKTNAIGQAPISEQEAVDQVEFEALVGNCSQEMIRTGVKISLVALAEAKDLQVVCAHAFPQYGVYLFSFDCTLFGKRLHSVNIGKHIMTVINPNPKEAIRIAEEGLLKTRGLVQAYMNGERLTGNEGMSTHIH